MARAAVNPKTGLTVQQEAFCQEFVKNSGHGSAAYRATYKTKGVDATVRREVHDLLHNPNIAQRISELQRELSARTIDQAVANKEYVEVRLKRIVERSMQASPVFDRRGEPVMILTEDGRLAAAYVFDGKTATRALELLGTEAGMFVKRAEQGNPGAFDELGKMSFEELCVRAQKKAVRLGLGKVLPIGKAKNSSTTPGRR